MRSLLLFVLSSFTLVATAQRNVYNFNYGWKLFVGDPAGAETPSFNDGAWKNVSLPYAWNEDDAFMKDIVDLRTGIAWYRKIFTLPDKNKGGKVFIEFEGVRQGADIYINGKKAGFHENGVMAFGFDISDIVVWNGKENTIAVRTDNNWDYRERNTNTKHQWADRNFNANYGGIPKNVRLHVTGTIYQTLPLYTNMQTTGVYVYASGFDIKGKKATVNIASEVKNESDSSQEIQLEATVSEKNGRVIGVFPGEKKVIKPGETLVLKAAKKFSGLEFWSWGYGYLYDVHTRLKVSGQTIDQVKTTTGFRKTAFKDGMIYLNDRVIMVHGYAQRTSNEWPAVGMSVPAWLSDYSNRLMVESGGNLVRWMHITPWKQDVESCDRVGLMQAMPAGDAEKDVTGRRWEQRTEVMRDAIIYNRNNPSIIFYESGNESISEAHMMEMIAIRDQYDPFGGRAIGSREMLDSKTAEYGGEMLYINKSGHIPMWAMEYSRDEGSRKYWDEHTPPYHLDGEGPQHKGQDASAYNRNQDSHAKENIVRWYEFWRERPGTGKRVSAGGVNIVFSETNTHHRGEDNYRRSGEVDALRIPKENFYAHQVMWDGWVEPEKPRIHVVGHWNYEPGVVKDVYVISSAEKVALFVNGQKREDGIKEHGFLFTFKNVAFAPGNIRAVGYDAQGKEICSTVKKTAGDPVSIRLKQVEKPGKWLADGHDLVLVEVEVVDKDGNRCPTAMHPISFDWTGPMEWRGGMAKGPENYILSKMLPVECGVNRVLIRSTTSPGKIVLTATAPLVKATSLALETTPFSFGNGISENFPAATLPVNLGRGPTPSTPSYSVQRKTLPMRPAGAGFNDSLATRSFDDNELSDWHNNGQLSTAWIEYELTTPATVHEVSMKLNNFRSRVYPLRILVDGNVVFQGNTQLSLGYFTTNCTPVKGKKIRVELMGSAAVSSQETMSEVNGKKLDDGVARDDDNAKGTLSIIEIEFYERVAQGKK